MEPKTLHNNDTADAKKTVSDVLVVGDPDMFKLLCKASSKEQGWMKATKAMEITKVGCLVQVTTQQRNSDGSYSVAEALSFVPGVRVVDDKNGGRALKPNL
jgi:hypothetical protein